MSSRIVSHRLHRFSFQTEVFLQIHVYTSRYPGLPLIHLQRTRVRRPSSFRLVPVNSPSEGLVRLPSNHRHSLRRSVIFHRPLYASYKNLSACAYPNAAPLRSIRNAAHPLRTTSPLPISQTPAQQLRHNAPLQHVPDRTPLRASNESVARCAFASPPLNARGIVALT